TPRDQQGQQPPPLSSGDPQPHPSGAMHHFRRQWVTAPGHASSTPAATDKTTPRHAGRPNVSHGYTDALAVTSTTSASASSASASTGRAHPAMPGRMAGRRALVTGGAGAIGLACARRLLAEGAEVVLLDRSADALSAAGGAGAAAVACDIRDPGAVAAAVARAAGLLNGPADVLVNSAGVYRIAPLLDLTPGEWDDVL